MKKALITGITGQDGSYLAELLISKGYEVHGLIRRSSSLNTARIDHIYQKPQNRDRLLFLHYGDLTDSSNISSIVNDVRPDEVYNLAAQSHVAVSFESPEYTSNVNALGTVRLLEALKLAGLHKNSKFYQASTSELYGLVQESPQTENTPFYPRSPYAVSKLYAYWIVVNYREAYNMYACNGVLFNHESPRRGETFVTRKITKGLCDIALGLDDCLYLGNLNAKRDWGHARDYVEMQWLMLQQSEARDYVISSGQQYSVKEFITWAARALEVEIEFEGYGLSEIGRVVSCNHSTAPNINIGQVIVRIDPKYYRPTEVETLLGNSQKAKKDLGWLPKISAEEMCIEMIHSDLEAAKKKLIIDRKN